MRYEHCIRCTSENIGYDVSTYEFSSGREYNIREWKCKDCGAEWDDSGIPMYKRVYDPYDATFTDLHIKKKCG